MNGTQLIARLCDLWRPKKTHENDVVFLLDEGGRQQPLRLMGIRETKTPKRVVTVFDLRRMQ